MEYHVAARQIEARYVAAPGREALLVGFHCDYGLSAFELDALVGGSHGVDALEAVFTDKRVVGKAEADFLLLAGVDAAEFAGVGGGGHTAVGNQLKSLLLGLAEIA